MWVLRAVIRRHALGVRHTGGAFTDLGVQGMERGGWRMANTNQRLDMGCHCEYFPIQASHSREGALFVKSRLIMLMV